MSSAGRGGGGGGSGEVCRIEEAQVNALGEHVLQEFDKRCGQLMQRLLEQRENANDTDNSVIEIEARAGSIEQGGFRPGVSSKFFNGMRGYCEERVKNKNWKRADDKARLVEMTHTNHIDVVFEDDVRVTTKLHFSQANKSHVDRVEVVEVITKRALGRKVDFRMHAPKHQDRMHLRVGVSCEESIAPGTEKYDKHVRAATKALMDSFNVSSRVKILGGIEMTLRKDLKRADLMPPPGFESLARGHMGLNDPVHAASQDNSISGKIACQLKWTLLNPSQLAGLEGQPNVQLRDTTVLEPSLWLTNLPGVVVVDSVAEGGGTRRHVAFACQYIIKVRLQDVLCGHGRFAKPLSAQDANDNGDANDAADLPVKVYRNKKRWSFLLRANQRLDLTETQQSNNPVSLINNLVGKQPVYEVEIEKLLSSGHARTGTANVLAHDIKATHHAEAFLADIASRIYGFALPPIPDFANPPHPRWKEQFDRDMMRRKKLFQAIGDIDNRAVRMGGGGALTALQHEVARTSGDNNDEDAQDDEGHTDQAGTAKFYSQLDRSKTTRSDSLIFHMRCLNNFVKSVVLKEAIMRTKAALNLASGAKIAVLDLACGKGADMPKFIRAAKDLKLSIDHYVGVDIARGSLEDAVKRLETMRPRPNFRVRFVEADLGVHHLSAERGGENDFKQLDQWDSARGADTWEKHPPSETIHASEKFDILSIQFSLHYMFQDRNRAHHFFSSAASRLKTGAVFIATTVYANEMLNKLMQAGPGATDFRIKDQFGVEAVHVQFADDVRNKIFSPSYAKKRDRDPDGEFLRAGPVVSGAAASKPENDENDPMLGIRYTFTLRDDEAQAAVAAPEWLVPFQLLVKIATVHHLRLVRYERLPNAAHRYMERDQPRALYRRMNVLNHEGSISQTEWDIASLYVVIELQKEDPPEDYRDALNRLKMRIPGYDHLPNDERASLLDQILARPDQ